MIHASLTYFKFSFDYQNSRFKRKAQQQFSITILKFFKKIQVQQFINYFYYLESKIYL